MVKQEFEYIAKAPSSGQPKKLVFLFHGYGLDARAMQKMADLLAEEIDDVLVIMPHAPERFRMPEIDDNVLRVPQQLVGEDSVIETGRQWFDITGSNLMDYREPIYRLAAQLNTFIDDMRDEHGLADEDIAIMGFSQGGAVATYTAMLRDNPVASLVAHSTVFLGGESLNSIMPTLFIYGHADEEFKQHDYKEIIAHLKTYVPSLETQSFEDLTHKTSEESRRAAAAFIKKNFGL